MTAQFTPTTVWVEVDGRRNDVGSVKAAKKFITDQWPNATFVLTTQADEFRVIHVHQCPRSKNDMYPADAVIVEDTSRKTSDHDSNSTPSVRGRRSL